MQRLGIVRRATVAGLAAIAVGSIAVDVVALAVPAGAETANRAAVVVEVDGVIHTAKVSFSTDSITGLDALRSAGFNPTVRVFGGNGGAVCALDIGTDTIGCPADGTCLTCAAPDYWAYYRALAGATKYTYSVAGAGNTQVHDGDVEAWTWSTGTPPSRFVSFRDVWGPDPPTTTRPPPTAPPTTAHATPTTSPPVSGLGAPTTTAGSTPSSGSPTTVAKVKGGASTTTSRGSTSTTGVIDDRGAAPTDDSGRIASAPIVSHRGGGSAFGLVAFAVILLALLAAIVVARRRRARAAPAA